MLYAGQKVVCIDDEPLPGRIWEFKNELKKGLVYTIKNLRIDEDGDLICQLLEVSRGPMSRAQHGPDCGYLARRFRPVTDISVFTEILKKVQEKV